MDEFCHPKILPNDFLFVNVTRGNRDKSWEKSRGEIAFLITWQRTHLAIAAIHTAFFGCGAMRGPESLFGFSGDIPSKGYKKEEKIKKNPAWIIFRPRAGK